MMMRMMNNLVAPNKPSKQMAMDIAKIITDAGTWTPRSKQVSIGPSEIGHECLRRLAYKLIDIPKVNEGSNGNWAAQVGTAIHAHLAEIFEKIEGFKTEQKVTIRGGLSGTVDLYDEVRGIVMDWKTTGASGLKERRSSGATTQQQIQVQLYGYGLAQQGLPVNQVALIYLPTSGGIDDMHIELYDYDEKIALAALERLDNLYALLTSIDVEQFPSMWAVIPKVSSRLCNYCPYFQPFSKDESVACAGDTI